MIKNSNITGVVFEKIDNDTPRLTQTSTFLQSRTKLIEQKEFYENELVLIQVLLDETNARIKLLNEV